jgi:hypothetical protein
VVELQRPTAACKVWGGCAGALATGMASGRARKAAALARGHPLVCARLL